MHSEPPQLFYGLYVDAELSHELEKRSKQERFLYIREGEKYLQEIKSDGIPYIGKRIQTEITLEQLNLLRINIYSLLQVLIPDYSLEQKPLEIFSVPSTPS